MPVQALPNGKLLQLDNSGNAKIAPQGVDTNDLMSMLLQPRTQDPRAGTFGPYAGANASLYGSYAGLLGNGVNAYASMPNAYASALNGYGGVLGNLATAASNTDAARYGAYAKNTSDYQNMLGGLGVAALGAYGNASNAALQSQAMRDTAAFKMFGDASAANQSALAQYGGQQAAAQAALGHAAANAGTGMAAARGALGNAYSSLGSSGMGALANVAGNSMNYTRDMGKLDLARTLGGGAINAMGNLGAGLTGGTYSISGPSGTIASTGGKPSGGSTYASGPAGEGQSQFNPGQGWYSTPQYYDAGGKESVLGALTSSQKGIADQGAGIDRDAGNTFSQLSSAGNRIADSGVLSSLNSNFGKSWSDMADMYRSGRQDSRTLLQDAYKGTLGMASPFLTAGREAFGAGMNNMPRPTQAVQPYLSGYMNGMNQFMATQNQNIGNALNSGNTALNNSMNSLNSNFGATMNALGSGVNGGLSFTQTNNGWEPSNGNFIGPSGSRPGFVKTSNGWEPVGPGFNSPQTQWAIDSGLIQDPRYSGQPSPGNWSMPSYPQSPSDSASVKRAQQLAQMKAIEDRLQYYRSLTESQRDDLQFNPNAQAEVEYLMQLRDSIGRAA